MTPSCFRSRLAQRLVVCCTLLASTAAPAFDVIVTGGDGAPLPLVMITVQPAVPLAGDRSDNGYARPGVPMPNDRWETAFTDATGVAHFNIPVDRKLSLRARKPGYADATGALESEPTTVVVVALARESDPKRLADQKPGNVWAAAIDLGDAELNRHFRKQCTFCHQQGLPTMRSDRSEAAWAATIERMIRYGSRLPTHVQQVAPAKLRAGYLDLAAHPEKLAEPRAWQDELVGVRMQEWPIGDAMSQMHDMLVHDNGKVYVGDNLQDRMYEVDPGANVTTVWKTPRSPGDTLGGLFAARLAAFPKHETYTSIHSLAVSARDGHIFLTPSTQRRMIEFAPETRKFIVHELDDGLYPHTVRIDARDRVWFTLALSNQVGMIDRASGQQHFLDLPTRSAREAVTIRAIPAVFAMAPHGFPLSKMKIDDGSSGVPLPYGIDVTPDGDVYVARLHANDIIRIDGKTLEIEQIPFPADGPRRLRADAEGNLWITAFGDSAIVRFRPSDRSWKTVPLPTEPLGSDVAYSLNIDRDRRIVWVTGTASDTLNAFHIDTGQWTTIPLPHKLFFTRDIEIDKDGSVYSSNGAFPGWLIEGAQPTLIRVTPPWAGSTTTTTTTTTTQKVGAP